jgi:hypothetical protein
METAMRVFAPLVLSIMLFSTPAALACSCRAPSAQELIASSAAIFAGTAQRSRPVTARESVTTFRVSRGYKGVASGRTIRVRHNSGPSPSCGVSFTRGQLYVLTTNRGRAGTGMSASLCSVAVMRSPAGKQALQMLRR